MGTQKIWSNYPQQIFVYLCGIAGWKTPIECTAVQEKEAMAGGGDVC
jgi:hypothetical protein